MNLNVLIKCNKNLLEPIWNKISNYAKEFIKKLLCYNPEDRISAIEALNDPWIVKSTTKEFNEEDLIIPLEKLRCFKTQMTFQKAVLAYIASQQLSKKEEKKLREVFEILDEDKNGTISREELTKGYMIVYKDENRAKSDVERVMRHIDINQNGSIDYNGIFKCLIMQNF